MKSHGDTGREEKGPIPGLLQYLKVQYRRRHEQEEMEVGGATGTVHALEAKSRKCFKEMIAVKKLLSQVRWPFDLARWRALRYLSEDRT